MKEPITTEMLEAIVCDASALGSPLRSEVGHGLFAGFLRFDELINLRPCDFQLQVEMMSIQIFCSKLHQGDSVVVARTGTPTCPVAMLEQYFAMTCMSVNDERFLFRPI